MIKTDAGLQTSASAPAAVVYAASATTNDFQLKCMCAATFIPSSDHRHCVCPRGTALNGVSGTCETPKSLATSANLQAAPQLPLSFSNSVRRTLLGKTSRLPTQILSQYNVTTANFRSEQLPFAIVDRVPKQKNDDSQYFYQNQ